MHAHLRRPARATGAVLAAGALALGALYAVPSAAEGSTTFPPQLVRVDTPARADKDRLAALGLDLTEHAGPGFVEVVLHSGADADALRAAGLTYDVEIPDLALRTAQNNRVSRAYACLLYTSPSPRDS